MIQFSVQITLFSKDIHLEEYLNNILSQISYAYHLVCLPEFSLEAYQTSDLVILQEVPALLLQQKISADKVPPKIILYSDQQDTVQMAQQHESLFADIWQHASQDIAVRLRLKNILDSIVYERKADTYERSLDTLIDSVPDLIWFKDTKGAHLKINDSFCAAVGKTKQQIQGRGHYFIWDLSPDDYAKGEFICLESEDITIEAGKTCIFDENVLFQNKMHKFKTYKTPLRNRDGSIWGTVGFAQDVTNLLNAEAELSLFINAMPFPLVLCDEKGCISNVNKRFHEIFSQDDILGSSLEEWKKQLTYIQDSTTIQVEVPSSGSRYLFNLTETFLTDVFNARIGTLIVFTDITAHKQVEELLRKQANTDAITGLCNRYPLRDHLQRCISLAQRYNQPFSILYMDLDFFKRVNDTFGHEQGDFVLATFAKILLNNCRGDTLAARIGGEEFVLLLPMTELDGACALGERIRTVLRKTPMLPTGEHITVSIGAAQYKPGEEPDEIIGRADKAMYQAKVSGRDQLCRAD